MQLIAALICLIFFSTNCFGWGKGTFYYDTYTCPDATGICTCPKEEGACNIDKQSMYWEATTFRYNPDEEKFKEIMKTRKGCLLSKNAKLQEIDSFTGNGSKLYACVDSAETRDSLVLRTIDRERSNSNPKINSYSLTHGQCTRIQIDTKREWSYTIVWTPLPIPVPYFVTVPIYKRFCARLTDPEIHSSQYETESLDSYGRRIPDSINLKKLKVKKLCMFDDPDIEMNAQDLRDKDPDIQIFHENEPDKGGRINNKIVGKNLGCRIVSMQKLPTFLPDRLPSINAPIEVFQPCEYQSDDINGNKECINDYGDEKNTLFNNVVIIANPIHINACNENKSSGCVTIENTNYAANMSWITKCEGDGKACLKEKELNLIKERLRYLKLKETDRFRPIYGKIALGSQTCLDISYRHSSGKIVCGIDIGPSQLEVLNIKDNPSLDKTIEFVGVNNSKYFIKLSISKEKINVSKLKDTSKILLSKQKSDSIPDTDWELVKSIYRNLQDIKYELQLDKSQDLSKGNDSHFSPSAILKISSYGEIYSIYITPKTLKQISETSDKKILQEEIDILGLKHSIHIVNDNNLNLSSNNTRCLYKTKDLNLKDSSLKDLNDILLYKDGLRCAEYANETFSDTLTNKVKLLVNNLITLSDNVNSSIDNIADSKDKSTSYFDILNPDRLYLSGYEKVFGIYFKGGDRICVKPETTSEKYILVYCAKDKCIDSIDENIDQHQTLVGIVSNEDVKYIQESIKAKEIALQKEIEQFKNKSFNDQYLNKKTFNELIKSINSNEIIETTIKLINKTGEVAEKIVVKMELDQINSKDSRDSKNSKDFNSSSFYIKTYFKKNEYETSDTQGFIRPVSILDPVDLDSQKGNFCTKDKIKPLDFKCELQVKDSKNLNFTAPDAKLGEKSFTKCIPGYVRSISLPFENEKSLIDEVSKNSIFCGLKTEVTNIDKSESESFKLDHKSEFESKKLTECSKEKLTTPEPSFIKCSSISRGKCEELKIHVNQGEIVISSLVPISENTLLDLELNLKGAKALYSTSNNVEIKKIDDIDIDNSLKTYEDLIKNTYKKNKILLLLKVIKNISARANSETELKDQTIRIQFLSNSKKINKPAL